MKHFVAMQGAFLMLKNIDPPHLTAHLLNVSQRGLFNAKTTERS